MLVRACTQGKEFWLARLLMHETAGVTCVREKTSSRLSSQKPTQFKYSKWELSHRQKGADGKTDELQERVSFRRDLRDRRAAKKKGRKSTNAGGEYRKSFQNPQSGDLSCKGGASVTKGRGDLQPGGGGRKTSSKRG